MTRPVLLSKARREHDPPLTQEELAALVEVDQTYISLIEAGKRMPSPDLKTRLAKALGIAPSKLRFTAPGPSASVDGTPDRAGHTVGESR